MTLPRATKPSRVTGIHDDYLSLAELLSRSGSPLSLAELHGGLCGIICAGSRDAALRWLDELIDDCTADSATLADLASRLERLGQDSWQALQGMSMEFGPVLPSDDSPIQQRAEALGIWCHGFLAGLILGGLDLGSGHSELSEELSELVGDFSEISRAGADAREIEDEETGDRSLTELVEYVRVGTQYIFEELARKAGPASKPTLH